MLKNFRGDPLINGKSGSEAGTVIKIREIASVVEDPKSKQIRAGIVEIDTGESPGVTTACILYSCHCVG